MAPFAPRVCSLVGGRKDATTKTHSQSDGAILKDQSRHRENALVQADVAWNVLDPERGK